MVKMQPLMIVNISKLNTLECSTVHQIKMRLFKAVLSCSPRHSWSRTRIMILLQSLVWSWWRFSWASWWQSFCWGGCRSSPPSRPGPTNGGLLMMCPRSSRPPWSSTRRPRATSRACGQAPLQDLQELREVNLCLEFSRFF